ncbi:LuxR family transcriptional regulator [Pseudonocardia sp. EC080610-09]|uniref:response regulator transcription factor n=1 Tax=unclassified Pseudonocardia TaxID=2619320 RepID=UPI000705FEEA|nr:MULTISPECIES: response regulator transcription factor [unclassified Pseudonocardia]ALL75076.1 LuxR family transcriptional regulator [Pseudonocardia sp. EC080610-09]ALL82098.1 LuxR family transcriptional regulator [Pseudonocardia sp. EC080619-01]
MIRVLLADDQALVRSGFRALLGSQPDLEVVAEAGDGAEALAAARAQAPDVVLMDIRMPGTDGLTATREITGDPGLSGTRVIVLTTFTDDSYVFEAIRGGASGFLVKDSEPADLIHAIRIVHGGEALLAPAVTRTLIAEFAARSRGGPAASPRLDALTEREREVLAEVAAGLSNDEIAGRLHMSPTTAKTHVSRTMTKLGARDRAQLVVVAYESGLVRPGWTG